MLQTGDPVVRFKLEILEKALPADSVIVYGDVFRMEGGYALKLAESGCDRVLLLDTLETDTWLRRRLANGNLDSCKGDFSDAFFMASIREQFSVGVAFDVLLHQAPLLHTLHLMLEKVKHRFCFVQPMIHELTVPGAVIYLPGNSCPELLHPLARDGQIPSRSTEYKVFSAVRVNHCHWIWGLTRSFLHSALAGEFFAVSYESVLGALTNPSWYWYGCFAARRGMNAEHWSGPSRS